MGHLLHSTLLFILGITGIILNRTHLILMLMSIEVMLLAVNLNFIIFSVYLDDLVGQIFSLFILTVAAAESAVGISILVVYFKVRSIITLEMFNMIKN